MFISDGARHMLTGIKKIDDIIQSEYLFVIPSYQRGYRWEEKEVRTLLDDLWKFKQVKGDEKSYYLQPLELVEIDDKKYRVVDGQQRLTTIYLILYKLRLEGMLIKSFSLEYETKQYLTDYMNAPTESSAVDSPDQYYLSKAINAINQWFGEKKSQFPNIVKDFGNLLRNASFFWYCLEERGDSEIETAAFNRLNAGQIPLTPIELIKGKLFLSIKSTEERQILALEWDQIEHMLHNEDLWSFISQDEALDNRISLLFETYMYFTNNFSNTSNSSLLAPLLDDNVDMQKVWREVKSYARQIEEWYLDKNLYHLIGFLMYMGFGIKDILRLCKIKQFQKKQDFKKALKAEIRGQFENTRKRADRCSITNFDEILKKNYHEHRVLLSHILLLFNVIITDKEKNGFLRFPFRFYNETQRNNGWSLEHIHAQHQESKRENSSASWNERVKLLKKQLKDVSNSLEYKELISQELKEKIESLPDICPKEQWNELEENENEFFKAISNMSDEEMHQITNLALLSCLDNTVISNGFFDEKLKKIKELDCAGHFIPLGTKNVFLKYYSDNAKLYHTWDISDRKKYGEHIAKEIKRFFEEDTNNVN